jgi:hypothetical protein
VTKTLKTGSLFTPITTGSGLLHTHHVNEWQRPISKLGEISTTFEVKLTKSARGVEIDHPEAGETAPHLVYGNGELEIKP